MNRIGFKILSSLKIDVIKVQSYSRPWSMLRDLGRES